MKIRNYILGLFASVAVLAGCEQEHRGADGQNDHQQGNKLFHGGFLLQNEKMMMQSVAFSLYFAKVNSWLDYIIKF